jgi:hypothetical protein
MSEKVALAGQAKSFSMQARGEHILHTCGCFISDAIFASAVGRDRGVGGCQSALWNFESSCRCACVREGPGQHGLRSLSFWGWP